MHIPFIELEVRYSFDRPRRSTGGRVSFDRNIFNVTVDVLPRFFPQLVVHLGIEISIVELELSMYVLSKKLNSKSTLHPVAHFFLSWSVYRSTEALGGCVIMVPPVNYDLYVDLTKVFVEFEISSRKQSEFWKFWTSIATNGTPGLQARLSSSHQICIQDIGVQLVSQNANYLKSIHLF